MWIPESIRFECQPDCSACCSLNDGKVYVSEKEAKAIADHLNLSERTFLDTYTSIHNEKYCLLDGPGDTCIFLNHPHCRIYEVRPGQCRTYPFWPENMKNKKRWKIVSDECPGIGKGKSYFRSEIREIMNGGSLDSAKK